jgi:hypothetical protein
MPSDMVKVPLEERKRTSLAVTWSRMNRLTDCFYDKKYAHRSKAFPPSLPLPYSFC